MFLGQKEVATGHKTQDIAPEQSRFKFPLFMIFPYLPVLYFPFCHFLSSVENSRTVLEFSVERVQWPGHVTL